MNWEELKKYSLKEQRLTEATGECESHSLKYLLTEQHNEDIILFYAIKNNVLYMDDSDITFRSLSEHKKADARMLMEHEDVVDVVLATLFQWFGTHVGSYEMHKLQEELIDIAKKKSVRDFMENEKK